MCVTFDKQFNISAAEKLYSTASIITRWVLCFESLSLLSSELLSRLGQAAGAEDTGQWDLSVAGRWFPSSPRPSGGDI